jgi:ligand-binding sensor domain-containing protein
VRALHEDESGHLWLATKGGGLARFHPETHRVDLITTEHGLPGNELLALRGGNDGDLWIGTVGHGVVRYWPPRHGDLPAKKGHFEYYPLSDRENGTSVYTLFVDASGTLWAGADALGVAEYVPAETPGEPGRRSTASPRTMTA